MQNYDDKPNYYEANQAGNDDQSEWICGVDKQLKGPVARWALRRKHYQLRVGNDRSPDTDWTRTANREGGSEALYVVVRATYSQVGIGSL